MNLEAASLQHRNVVISFAALLSFAMGSGIGSSEEQGPIVLATFWVLTIFHGVSVFRLIRFSEPHKYAWAIFAFFSVALFFDSNLRCNYFSEQSL